VHHHDAEAGVLFPISKKKYWNNGDIASEMPRSMTNLHSLKLAVVTQLRGSKLKYFATSVLFFL
jgi:hypothetical protein